MESLKKYISQIEDFPRKGTVFKDLNPIYKKPKVWKKIIMPLKKLIYRIKPDYIAGIEARGFLTGAPIAFDLDIGFISIRKPNKLPGKVIGINYDLEYGNDRLEIQQDLFKENSKIIIIDDVLATGGTASAAGQLIKMSGGDLVGYGFLIELTNLKGRKKLHNKLIVESVVKF
tara:strand:- start:300 stop:818 length:519 start_codon:yes stop_codon:yes gene_type:complete